MNSFLSRGELLLSFFILGMLITMAFISILTGFILKARKIFRSGFFNLLPIVFLMLIYHNFTKGKTSITLIHYFILFSIAGISLCGMLYWYTNFLRTHTTVTSESKYEKEDGTPQPPSNNTTEIHSGLTDRELEVLKFTAEGMTDKEIADALHLSVPTIKTHLRNVYNKLQVRNRVEATLKYKRMV